MSAVIPAPRLLNFLALLGCIAAMAGALYLQHVDGLEPCPLCIFQRVGVMAAALVLLVASLHGPKRIGVRLYGLLTALAAIGGGAVAIRHIWLQNLPPDQVPACGPGLEYMMDVFPMQNVIQQVLAGSGECADMDWSFLGLSLPSWSLVVFAGLLVLALIQMFRPLPR
ncbi:MAG: disulfide bond formation protein B [Alcanivoracaceae bacterium]|uniref:disulfide bond formation protein B n=1 Tax=Alcanivorax sp. MD8A TaxID=1177157 RepID=UPI000C619DD5|nr:disulfide bond formation protein B [Alcanivorax sp. MD8A]MAX56132.1 disulfide bond formation protein B [Alcanivoracaceae bacterium]MED5432090.1 disulfide bond formation protein B [Pseudomonadota bacterium]MEE2869560.1 disulfide bond formation protein B [Pseudomonadota bacterium]PNE01999.1 disulfide bond formation protein B [Alcanivorax sp. MD8A]|tara:strand:+ start:4019 stop:4522 length:504 start_codon:yes stop_codon:yes gene_type:complete